MIMYPDTLTDRGCWISDDRVYAFVSSAAGGVTEVGYHGAQPVSRNTRVLVHTEGALQFRITTRDRVRQTLVFEEFDWYPGSVKVRATCPAGTMQVEIVVSGRSLTVSFSGVVGEIGSLVIQLNTRALFTEVHGHRIWGVHGGPPGWMRLRFHDRILLNEWMKREGPYGSDFLIPERFRRKIYRRAVRSGLATPADLLPEYRGASLPIYDEDVRLAIGGEGYEVMETGDMILYTTPVTEGSGSTPRFSIRFDADQHNEPKIRLEEEKLTAASASPVRRTSKDPEILLPGFKHMEQFFSTVPGLVDSCIVRDHGVPRATPGGYYWIWAWDAMAAALVALRWGATDLARQTAEFVNAHRDDGLIPMRWTPDLEPLDTQLPGALETLLASLSYALTRELPEEVLLHAVYPHMTRHLEDIEGRCDGRGLFRNIGFYPDLPLRFGRTESSAVALEVAAFYAFCRTCENSAELMHDKRRAGQARRMISLLEDHFHDAFWDPSRGFFVDAVDMETGSRNQSYPLFSLFFLHWPPALQLIRLHLPEAADFIRRELLTPVGMRMLPAWDRNAGSETVSGSWYPHWDAYALKLFRKAGFAAEIMSWLGCVESALEHLGYVPEYLSLDASLLHDASAWRRHGAASNLNCVTGVYQALLEGVFGLDFEPGGLTIVPLALPVGESAVRGVYHLATQWNVTACRKGPRLQHIRVDGKEIQCCMKLPKRLHDGGEHAIELQYGEGAMRPHLSELTNAEVLDLAASPRGIEAEINALGRMELVFSAPEEWAIFVDGRAYGERPQRVNEHGFISLGLPGKHIVQISSRA